MLTKLSRPYPILVFSLTALVISAGGLATAETPIPAAPPQIPDLEWQPTTFRPDLREPVRYIDFVDGNDSNPGTREQPWKHHPWDRNAEGRAAAGGGAATYVFKGGVTYRGTLGAQASGTARNPIRLTSDPGWGDGEAILSGADILQAEWRACTPAETEALPAPSRSAVYCTSLQNTKYLQYLWTTDASVTQVHLARLPNWTPSLPGDPRSEWLELDEVELEMEIELSSTAGIKPGDRLVPADDRRRTMVSFSSDNGERPWVAEDVRQGHVIVLASHWPRGGLKHGTPLSNAAVSPTVIRTSGTHSLIRRLHDGDVLNDPALGDLSGATMRVELPGTQKLATGPVVGNNAAGGFVRADVRIAPDQGPRAYDRYFLEGLPNFLDQAGEFALSHGASHRRTLYLRLPEDRDPNNATIELPVRESIIDIGNQQHIDISGLTFRFTALPPPGTLEARHAALHSTAIRIHGDASDIDIHHCRFAYLESGVVAYPDSDDTGEILDHLKVTDSEFIDIDGSAIIMGSGQDRAHYRGKSRLIHASVLRNRITSSGTLPMTHWGQGAFGHGIDITGAEVAEVAYNHVLDVGGAGVNLYLGSQFGASGIAHPFLRGLIHHNKVTNSLLGLQDFGGIESWLGGPMYIYNNISINPGGYRHGNYRRNGPGAPLKQGSYGVGIYLDGQYKSYVFNNIAWGTNNDVTAERYNAAAFNEAMGFMNTVFNNTFLRFGVGIHKGMSQHSRSYYLGNLLLDMGYGFFVQQPHRKYIDHETLAYTRNVLYGNPTVFAQLGREESPARSMAEWRTTLDERSVMASGTGTTTQTLPIRDADGHDFRPSTGSPALDTGVKVFVPWALSRVVGEWHFFRSRKPTRVIDESLNMNKLWLSRSMFQDIPRQDLRCPNSTANDYVSGTLEDWIAGALRFDGQTQHCFVENAALTSGFDWHDTKNGKSGSFRGVERDTVDIDRDSFLIEAVLATAPNAGGFGIIAKRDGKGYELDVKEDGTLSLILDDGSAAQQVDNRTAINDGQWHHIVVEADRGPTKRVTFYIDGIADPETSPSALAVEGSLSNTGDFYIGRSSAGLFRGRMDFVRLAKGTLANAETTIRQLHNWEFRGPHLHDFTGAPPTGKSRDAGAVELTGIAP